MGDGLHDVVSDKQTMLTNANTSRVNNRNFFEEVASAMDPINGLETTDTNAPSAKKIEVYR